MVGERVKSYETMIQVLYLVESRPMITLTEIAESLGTSKSTAYRHLSSLDEHNLVTKQSGGYQLGLGLLNLGEKARSQRRIYDIARRKVEEAAQQSGENIWISVEDKGEIVYLYRASGEHYIETYAHPGYRSKPHLLAAGKVILAHMDRERAEEIISALDFTPQTKHTITDEAELRAQLEDVRQEGVAYNLQEVADDLHAIAAPVLSTDNDIYGSISIFGPANRLTENQLRTEYKELLLQLSEEIKLFDRYG